MSDLRYFFDERKDEVNTYFEFINYLGIDDLEHKTIEFDSQNSFTTTDKLDKVLKSNCILILYNLIEGVITKSMEYMIDHINDNNIKYGELQLGFKQLILKTSLRANDFKDRNMALVEFIDTVFDEIFNFTFNTDTKKYVLGGGGNIDARFIRKITENFRISFSRSEDELRNIKSDRNDLAHGSKSFVECSQTKTLSEIQEQKRKIFDYLNDYIMAIDEYIDNEKYRI
jgi:hypothetical protein